MLVSRTQKCSFFSVRDSHYSCERCKLLIEAANVSAQKHIVCVMHRRNSGLSLFGFISALVIFDTTNCLANLILSKNRVVLAIPI